MDAVTVGRVTMELAALLREYGQEVLGEAIRLVTTPEFPVDSPLDAVADRFQIDPMWLKQTVLLGSLPQGLFLRTPDYTRPITPFGQESLPLLGLEPPPQEQQPLLIEEDVDLAPEARQEPSAQTPAPVRIEEEDFDL